MSLLVTLLSFIRVSKSEHLACDYGMEIDVAKGPHIVHLF